MRTLGQIVGAIKRHKPKTAAALLRDCKLPLVYLQSGMYRDAYEVVNSGYVVKLPLERPRADQREECIEHSVTEYNAYRRIMRSKKLFAPLHPYMPNVRYFNENTGVMVMDKYDTDFRIGRGRERINVERIAAKLFGNDEIDLHSENIGFDASGQLKVIDLGYFV